MESNYPTVEDVENEKPTDVAAKLHEKQLIIDAQYEEEKQGDYYSAHACSVNELLFGREGDIPLSTKEREPISSLHGAGLSPPDEDISDLENYSPPRVQVGGDQIRMKTEDAPAPDDNETENPELLRFESVPGNQTAVSGSSPKEDSPEVMLSTPMLDEYNNGHSELEEKIGRDDAAGRYGDRDCDCKVAAYAPDLDAPSAASAALEKMYSVGETSACSQQSDSSSPKVDGERLVRVGKSSRNRSADDVTGEEDEHADLSHSTEDTSASLAAAGVRESMFTKEEESVSTSRSLQGRKQDQGSASTSSSAAAGGLRLPDTLADPASPDSPPENAMTLTGKVKKQVAQSPFLVEESPEDDDGAEHVAVTNWGEVWNEKFPERKITGGDSDAYVQTGSLTGAPYGKGASAYSGASNHSSYAGEKGHYQQYQNYNSQLASSKGKYGAGYHGSQYQYAGAGVAFGKDSGKTSAAWSEKDQHGKGGYYANGGKEKGYGGIAPGYGSVTSGGGSHSQGSTPPGTSGPSSSLGLPASRGHYIGKDASGNLIKGAPPSAAGKPGTMAGGKPVALTHQHAGMPGGMSIPGGGKPGASYPCGKYGSGYPLSKGAPNTEGQSTMVGAGTAGALPGPNSKGGSPPSAPSKGSTNYHMLQNPAVVGYNGKPSAAMMNTKAGLVPGSSTTGSNFSATPSKTTARPPGLSAPVPASSSAGAPNGLPTSGASSSMRPNVAAPRPPTAAAASAAALPHAALAGGPLPPALMHPANLAALPPHIVAQNPMLARAQAGYAAAAVAVAQQQQRVQHAAAALASLQAKGKAPPQLAAGKGAPPPPVPGRVPPAARAVPMALGAATRNGAGVLPPPASGGKEGLAQSSQAAAYGSSFLPPGRNSQLSADAPAFVPTTSGGRPPVLSRDSNISDKSWSPTDSNADEGELKVWSVYFQGQYVANVEENGEEYAVVDCKQMDELFGCGPLRVPKVYFQNKLVIGNVLAFRVERDPKARRGVAFKKGSQKSPTTVDYYVGTVRELVAYSRTEAEMTLHCLGTKAIFGNDVKGYANSIMPLNGKLRMGDV
eukprot:GSA25T00005991001.1